MALISLLWFGGMAPRYGEQHLSKPHATEAENCKLYSGELRPLTKPALAHQFCRPGEPCWFVPLTPEPPVENPPEPPACVPVVITSQPTSPLVLVGSPATFSVGVNTDATAPVNYQWYRNNELMPGEVASALVVNVTAENLYDYYAVSVQNPCGEAVSIPAKPNPDIPPECLPYACDAMEQDLLDAGFPVPRYTTADSTNFPWPFADSGSNIDIPGSIACWNWFVSSPVLQTDWSYGGYIDKVSMAGWDWYNEAKKFAPCFLEDPDMCIQINGNSSVPETTTPINSPGGGGTATMVFTGSGGGDYAVMDMNRIPRARYHGYNADDTLVMVNTGVYYANIRRVDANNHRITLELNDNVNGVINVAQDIGPVGGQWWLWTCSEHSSLVQNGNVFDVYISVSITVTNAAGQSFNIGATGLSRRSVNGVVRVELTGGSSIYEVPKMWIAPATNYAICIGQIAYGGDGQENHDEIKQAWLRNIQGYEPPPECQ